MGVLSTLLIYRLGKRRANKQRDRKERRDDCLQAWNNTKTIAQDEWEPMADVWSPDPQEWQPYDGSE